MRVKHNLLSMIACLALFMAKTSVGTCCYWVLYQPKMPDKLRQ
ncbi:MULTISPECIES: cyclic lactone autoinducer peptide [Lutispora]|uniref:Cyclic lactone autoinducer peptide n=1 Tax=Lutispora saccharofermentans TaxID=3024236 RepID=A0ABT1NJZ4_9FIRM|nr:MULTISPECIES: cyclic lactone autoinducer peptide [Lutispora]MCQ1531597.1 cyclic lactone autoinducer peptide [Lutispora saccharofermentans]MEA4962451.1 cyclic lactone autoinducer peptide [Lutispora sp.]